VANGVISSQRHLGDIYLRSEGAADAPPEHRAPTTIPEPALGTTPHHSTAPHTQYATNANTTKLNTAINHDKHASPIRVSTELP